MPETVTIASRLPVAIRIADPNPDPEKPGEAPPARSAVINGARHPGSVGEAGITRGVDADLWRKWLEANKNNDLVQGGLLAAVQEDQADAVNKAEYGFQPGLERVAQSDAEAASKGSTVTESGPLRAVHLAATSDAPMDDSPRSQTRSADAPAMPHTPSPAAQPAPAMGQPASAEPKPVPKSPATDQAPPPAAPAGQAAKAPASSQPAPASPA